MATCAGEMGGWLVDMITGGRGREGRENFSCSIPGVVIEEPAKVSTGKVRVLQYAFLIVCYFYTTGAGKSDHKKIKAEAYFRRSIG